MRRRLQRPSLWLKKGLARIEVRDVFFVGGTVALATGLALYDLRVGLVVVGVLFVYLGVWHRGLSR